MPRLRLADTRRIAESGAEPTPRLRQGTTDVASREYDNRQNHKNLTPPAGFGSSQVPTATRFTILPSSVRTLFTGHNISMIVFNRNIKQEATTRRYSGMTDA